MESIDALRAYFSRVRTMLPELYNIAYAVAGTHELAEYALGSALLQGWTGGMARGIGLREGLRNHVVHAALAKAGSASDGAVWDGLHDASNEAHQALAGETPYVQRVAMLRWGCELKPMAIARATGTSRSQVREALDRLRNAAGAQESQWQRALRKSLQTPHPNMPPPESIYRTLSAEAMELKPPNRWFSRALGRALLALLVLVAAVIFWLTAVLIQPDAGLLQGDAEPVQTESRQGMN